MNYNKYIEYAKQNLSSYRFIHTVNVADRARQLAKKYGVDEEKAYLAGLLHDLTKEISFDEQIKMLENDGYEEIALARNYPKILHQITAPILAKARFDIKDEDVLNAISCHTTGRPNMTTLDMVVYLADLTSAERSFDDIEKTREMVDKSLLDGMLYALSFIINDLSSKKQPIHPFTEQCYEWVCEELKRK